MTGLTVVVPTFDEGPNVAELVTRLGSALRGLSAEVLFVDDSTDDTPDRVREAAATAELPVRLIHREGAARTGGLAGAVTVGLRNALGDHVVVMDGDLQHPPEMVPELFRTAVVTGADVVVASRYCGPGGEATGLAGRYRRAVSSGSTVLARGLFPRRVGAVCTDPMTGFFCVLRAGVDLGRLDPQGFKILLELLATHDLQVRELPFVFGERFAGESKAGWRQGATFLRQIFELRVGRLRQVVGFGAVGLSGFVVNLAVMAALVGLGLNYVVASLLATQTAIVSNFLLQERYVFVGRTHVRRKRHRALASFAFNNAENLLRVPALVLLVEVVGAAALPAQALTLVVAFGGRFLVLNRLVYASRPPALTTVPTRAGLTTARLPEPVPAPTTVAEESA